MDHKLDLGPELLEDIQDACEADDTEAMRKAVVRMAIAVAAEVAGRRGP